MNITVCLRTGRLGDRGSIPGRGERSFLLASVSRPVLGPTQPPVQWVPGVLSPGLKLGRGLTLTNHPRLVPRSRMSRSYTFSPPSASVECGGNALGLVYEHYSQTAAILSEPSLHEEWKVLKGRERMVIGKCLGDTTALRSLHTSQSVSLASRCCRQRAQCCSSRPLLLSTQQVSFISVCQLIIYLQWNTQMALVPGNCR
jgi:hypothetical protein